MITAKQARALAFIAREAITHPAHLAHLLWPGDPGWSRSMKCGRNENGLQKGAGLMMAAGGYLGRLAKAGLIFNYHVFGNGTREPAALTELGKQLLAEYKEAHGDPLATVETD